MPQQAELRLTFPIEVASKPSAASALFAQTKTQTPEHVTNTPITAVQDGRRILLELPASAGLVSESLVFIAEDGNLIARTSPVSHKAGSSDASLLLTLKDSFTDTLSSLTGTLIADGGAANRGWKRRFPCAREKSVKMPKSLKRKRQYRSQRRSRL